MTLRGTLLAALLCILVLPAQAGRQAEEVLSASVKSSLSRSVADFAAVRTFFTSAREEVHWMSEMSQRLSRHIKDEATRRDFLVTLHYEAMRAGLDPQLLLGLIEVESGFKKYAVSVASARGYMQVMPFWTKLIGAPDHNLFHLRTNLRYGTTILRHYLDIERGDLYRALGRYNGSLGQPQYPNAVVGAWKRHWSYTPPAPVTPARTRTAEAETRG